MTVQFVEQQRGARFRRLLLAVVVTTALVVVLTACADPDVITEYIEFHRLEWHGMTYCFATVPDGITEITCPP